ncbi:MAG: hypothetical protein ACLPJY_03655, partial [Rhodomicrobium sp.]
AIFEQKTALRQSKGNFGQAFNRMYKNARPFLPQYKFYLWLTLARSPPMRQNIFVNNGGKPLCLTRQ